MSLYKARKISSLRESLAYKLPRKILIRPDRLRGRYLFRSAVRRVLEYMEWISEEQIEEISDDVTIDIRTAQQKREMEKKLLTLKDRSILLITASERSSADKAYIYDLITKFHAFTKHSEDLRENLAAVCFYQYLPSGRVIVRQGHKARNLYFIINGEINLSKVVIDDLTGEEKVVDMGSIHPGDMFGEVALLHTVPRTSTIITATSVDLLLITEDDFNNVLRSSLTKKWDVLKDALVHFNYFKLWDEETIRECCILSKLKDFKPNEILLGDGKGMVNYVHFILKGKCRLIEHMLVHERPSYHGMQYELYETYGPQLRRNSVKTQEVDRLSIVTTTLIDDVKGWHEITDIAEILMREPSVTSELHYPSDVRTIFMQICTFSRGACFGLGENMLHRRIVALTPVRCFLIPRYWLFEHNRANIWGRVKLFLDLKYPTKKQLFNEFLLNRKWMTYKQNLVKDALNRRGHFHSNIMVHDVPYSIRITDEIDPKL
ncbi:CNBD2 protein, partial [Acromyrmex insinuator]